jgi:hypothetical protein
MINPDQKMNVLFDLGYRCIQFFITAILFPAY